MVHHHNHSHHHHHIPSKKGKKLLWVTLLNLGITLLQFVGGLLSNSLSLLSDAVHNLGDSSAIFIAFLAGKKSEQNPNAKYTFGYKRIEIIAALFNAAVLILICLFLIKEAVMRFSDPQAVHGKHMFLIALAGLFANLISVLVLHKEKDQNLNIKAAYLHLIGDTLSSVAVIAGGFAIWLFQMYWLDPLITLLVGLYIIHHTWQVLRQSFEILMQSTPDSIDIYAIQKEVEKYDDVDNMHHVHAWQLADHQKHFEAHINVEKELSIMEVTQLQEKLESLLKTKFNINHTTLQISYHCCSGQNELIHPKS